MGLRKPKNHTVIDMYKAWCRQELLTNKDWFGIYDARMRMSGIQIIYKLEDKKQVMIMSYTMFRLILEMHNKYASEAVIQGHCFNLGSCLGYIYAARIERNFNSPRCDMVATKRIRKEDPTHPAIFFTDADYCIIKWQKFFKVKNETVYEFKPAKHTMATNFYRAIAANPILKTLYKYIPYKHYYPLDPPLQQTA